MIRKIKQKKIFDLIFLVLIFAITALIYNFLLEVSSLSIVGDAQKYNGYQAYVIRYSLLNFGQFGLWDQFLSSGMSWISHPGGGLFSPFAWIAILTVPDINRGSLLIFYINAFFVSFSYYFLCRIIGLHRFTSFFVAILAISNQYTFMFVANGWFEEFFGLTIIPFTVGLLWLAISKKNYAYAILGGLAMSFNFLANSYYVFHYNVMCLLWIGLAFLVSDIYNIWRNKKRKIKRLKYTILLNIVFWLTFLGISAIKLIPLLEFRSLSARQYLPLSVVDSSNGVMTFDFFKSLIRDFIVPAGHTNFFTQWVNNLALIFLFASVIYFLFKKKFEYGVFLSLFLMGIWGYFAYRIPVDLYALLYRFLPGFSSNNYPYRFMIIIYFAFLVSVGLGLDLLINKKSKILLLLGVILGSIIVVGAGWYTTASYNAIKYLNMPDVKTDLKTANFTVKKLENHSSLLIDGKISSDLFVVLAKITEAYRPEGRTRSTISGDNVLTQSIILEQQIPVVHHSYNPIVPTYEYGIIPSGTTQDSLELTEKRYKILSILNTRFQIQGKLGFEFAGCKNLEISNATVKRSIIEKNPAEGACSFLEARLKKIIATDDGGIYYDSNVLPKITLISNPILLITDNSFNDFSSFIAKQIVFHKDFNIKNMTVLSGGSNYLDDYSINELKKFPVLILVNPFIKDKIRTDSLLNRYRKSGGKIIVLTGKKINYESLHERSSSIYTAKPAWSYDAIEENNMSIIFRTLKTNEAKDIKIKKFTPEDVIFEVVTKKNNEVLQFSDSFYPGWKASIDSRQVNVYMADGLVKGIVISQKGTHTIRFYYAPDSFRNGAMITGVTILLIGGLFILNSLGKIKL